MLKKLGKCMLAALLSGVHGPHGGTGNAGSPGCR